MLIIPLTGKISRQNPPIITIAIILVNCFVYFYFQTNENQAYNQAINYYFDSGLSQIEIPRYIAYLRKRAKDSESLPQKEKMDRQTAYIFYAKMRNDFEFLEKLHNKEIISQKDSIYGKWNESRIGYQQRLSKIVSLNYGFRPAYGKPVTFFTHMYLHGGLMHLLGNMVFLWIIGCMLEMGCGRIKFFMIYTLGGLISVSAFWLIYTKSTVPLIGASGAISGIMGALAVLFNKKKVRIFYSLGFYFNYVKIPAIILLPVWICNELYQLFFGGISNVAYVAHIGGFAGGAVLVYLGLKYKVLSNENLVEEEEVDKISPIIEEALKHIVKLDFKKGRKLLEQVLEKNPDNQTALVHLFNINKQKPQSMRFHDTSKKLLIFLCKNSKTYSEAYQIYIEYAKIAKPPRLSPQIYIRLCSIFSISGHHEKAMKIISALMKKKPDLPGIPSVLIKLAGTYSNIGMAEKSKTCCLLVIKNYPNSLEAVISKRMLSD